MSTAETIPGTTGTIQQRVTEVIENEVPAAYADLATRRVIEAIDAWYETARERARATAQEMFAGLMPGATGTAMADEVADKILASTQAADRATEK